MTDVNWRLNWNRQGPALVHPRGGVLSIRDGFIQRKLVMDPGELRGGSAMYIPETDEVYFQLEVFDKDGRSMSENVIAVARKRSPDPSLLVPTGPTLRPTVVPPVRDPIPPPMNSPRATPAKGQTLSAGADEE